jgi:phytoene dehydrogenase-like protein
MAERWDVVVVGGGLAGLTAATVAARAGKRTLLLERRETLGGRAHTHVWKGFHLNAGAHAFYTGGPGWAVLRNLGLRPRGAAPNIRGRGLRGGGLHLLPSGPLSLLATGLLDWKEKGAFLSLMSRLPKVDLQAASRVSCSEWLDQNVADPGLRPVMGAILRVSAYSGDLEHLRAATAIQRVLDSQKGIFYLDGGWSALVTGLTRMAREAGAEVRSQAAVSAMEARRPGFRFLLSQGSVIEAGEAVLALGPMEAQSILPSETAAHLRVLLGGARPAEATCLDLCLSRLPNPKVNLGMGIDEPLFMTAQSETARVAPEGGALVHLVRYHEGRAGEDPSAMRPRMEAFMDQLQPGWRACLLHARFLPAIGVAPVLDEPGRPRIGSGDLELPGLHLAGDWVGREGWLADASLASGWKAGLAIAAGLAACA